MVNERKCGFEGCERPYRAKGYCYGHWRQTRTGEPPRPMRVYVLRDETPEGTSLCTKCNNIKSDEAFYKFRNGNTYSRCKDCHKAGVLAAQRRRGANED